MEGLDAYNLETPGSIAHAVDSNVEKSSIPHESGMAIGGSLENSLSGSSIAHGDSILGKLHIDNSRCIAAHPQGSTFLSEPPALPRPSKRMRVMPSSSVVMETTDSDVSFEESTEEAKKRKLTHEAPGKKDEDEAPTDSGSMEVRNFGSDSNTRPRFRVTTAQSSSFRCRRCLLRISKYHLCVQPTDTSKAWWFHVSCAKDSIGSYNPQEIEGVSELSEGNQELLCNLLTAKIEYSLWRERTRRAFCTGCAEPIPLRTFRIAECTSLGKKHKYHVYHHLQCTSYPLREIMWIQGWKRMKKVDRQAVLDRIEEIKLLVDKENQELDPDELVQASFQGEIRLSPKGLGASLLPFQVEGFSWMVHQELHVPEIRGGILADEMVCTHS